MSVGMHQRVFELDCRDVKNFSEFISEVNVKFLSRIGASTMWNGNLDALNDFLSWPGVPYQVVILGSQSLEKALSQKSPDGELTLYDHLLDIFLSNSDLVRLWLR